MADFAGWEMPIQYRGIRLEHRQVRTGAGVFDVSHMGRLYLSGARAGPFLEGLLPCRASRLAIGQMAYTVLCNDTGGVIDDLVVSRTGAERYLLVVNASRCAMDLEWIRSRTGGLDARVEDRTRQQGMIAVQGPRAEALVAGVVGEGLARLRFFRCTEVADEVAVRGRQGAPWLVSRSGYTGEDGFEIICPAAAAPDLWTALLSAGAEPAGLAARDSLRLEAGLCLYGNELTEATTPLEAGLGWTLALDKEIDFPGRDALRRQREQGVDRHLVGFRLRVRGIPRSGHPVRVGDREVGVVTSGGHSPVLGGGIGMAWVEEGCHEPGHAVEVVSRGKTLAAEVVRLPFVAPRRKRHRRQGGGEGG